MSASASKPNQNVASPWSLGSITEDQIAEIMQMVKSGLRLSGVTSAAIAPVLKNRGDELRQRLVEAVRSIVP